MRIGVLPLARPTFDVPFAEENAAKAFAALDRTGHTILGSRALLFDAAAAEAAMVALQDEVLDVLLLLQVTFTDASMTVRIAEAATVPLAIWGFPEPRTGGRLRLNSFCGVNLAAHALGRAGRAFSWLYAVPDAEGLAGNLEALFQGQGVSGGLRPAAAAPTDADRSLAVSVLTRLKGQRIGLIGDHPAGFDTCRFDEDELRQAQELQQAYLQSQATARKVVPLRTGT
jgi:L-fucose isomerase-like protein